MGDCPSNFGQTRFVPHNPRFESTQIISVFPDYKIRVEFDTEMNQGLTPDKANFSMVFDDVPYEPTGLAWHDALHLDAWLSFGPDPAVGVFHQLNLDPNCISTQGAKSRSPQQIQWKP